MCKLFDDNRSFCFIRKAKIIKNNNVGIMDGHA